MGRNAKRRKEVKKMKRAEKGIVELNVKEIREKAIKHKKIKYSVGSQIGNVVAGNLIVRGPRF
ncbi:hypothetical protein ACQ9ZF_04915 [Cetobacterium somerae]|uniref:hypothetical protein n=1 Tax=Cetobacterium somerae TaxID=188913 RepID=UPI003D7683C3